MTNKLSFNSAIQKCEALFYSMLISVSTLVPAFAAKDLTEAAKDIINGIGTSISTLFNPACILCLAICIATLIFGRNSKTADASMSWAKRIVICFVIFNILGSVATWLVQTVGTGNAITDWGTAGTAFISLF